MIKERIKDFDKCINYIETIRDKIDDMFLKRHVNIMIQELEEIKERFIALVTYSEVI